MILGLPWSSWLLLLVAVGLGLAINLIFYFRNRREEPLSRTSEPGSPTDA